MRIKIKKTDKTEEKTGRAPSAGRQEFRVGFLAGLAFSLFSVAVFLLVRLGSVGG